MHACCAGTVRTRTHARCTCTLHMYAAYTPTHQRACCVRMLCMLACARTLRRHSTSAQAHARTRAAHARMLRTYGAHAPMHTWVRMPSTHAVHASLSTHAAQAQCTRSHAAYASLFTYAAHVWCAHTHALPTHPRAYARCTHTLRTHASHACSAR